MTHVRIAMTKHGRGEVFIDGSKIKSVCGVKFSAGVGEPNKVEITLLPEKIEIEGTADVTTIESECREFKDCSVVRA